MKCLKIVLFVFLACALMAASLVSAFAYSASSGDVTDFEMTFFWDTNINETNFALEARIEVTNYSHLTTLPGAASFVLLDSNQATVFDSATDEYNQDAGGTDTDECFIFYLIFTKPLIIRRDVEYTFVVGAGSFVSDSGQPCPELRVTFVPAEFLRAPTLWERAENFFYEIIEFFEEIQFMLEDFFGFGT